MAKGTPANPPTPPTVHGGKAVTPANPSSYGGVHPQPIGSSGTPPAGGNPKPGKGAPSQTKVESAFPVKKGRKSDIFSLPWVIVTILFIVLAYDVLTYWQQSVSIENTAVGAATWGVYALEGGKPSSGGNPSASRTGRQAGT